MKYESTILKRLIDTYGVVGNPRYISEIIKEFIVRGKECFPNLFTYQADWLAHIDEFGLTPEYTVSYTGQHIYAPNTKEKPVKSAILSGQTLVNLAPKKIIEYTASSDWDGFNVLVQNSKKPNEHWRTLQDLKPSTKYYISCYVETFEDVNGRDYYLNNSSHNCLFVDSMKVNGVGHYQWISTTRSELTDEIFIALRCQNSYARGRIKIRDIMIIEYQEGMENWDIPYFEGMQSVQMPVLTTSNEDGTKSNILTVDENVELGGIGDVQDTLDLMTGEVTIKTRQTTVTSENVNYNWSNDTHTCFYISQNDMINGYGETVKSNLFPSGGINEVGSKELVTSDGTKNIMFSILNARLSSTDLTGVIKFLETNKLNVRYLLATESIKTVDLTIHDKDHQKVERLSSFEGGTHFTTSSQDGSLLPTLTVDVVTDLEKTMMVCSLEGNTM